MSNNKEIQTAELERALELVANTWENDIALTEETMISHFDAICDLIDNDEMTFNEFTEEAGLAGTERLN